MKEFKVTFSEIVYFTTIIEAETIEEANYKFMDGDFGDCEEIYREYELQHDIEEV